jgi:hypothetical protein
MFIVAAADNTDVKNGLSPPSCHWKVEFIARRVIDRNYLSMIYFIVGQ